MNSNIKIFFLLNFILYYSYTFSQNEKDILKDTNHNYDSILSSDGYFLDVLFYKQRNDVLLNDLGPFGSPNYRTSTFSLNPVKRFYLNDKTLKDIYLLDGIKPFTNISYLNASRKEQLLSIDHFQKMGKLLSFSFNYTRMSSPGSYLNQEVNNTLFDVAFGYKSKKSIYSFDFFVSIKRVFLQENGGLFALSDFENNTYSNRRSYNVNLETSESSNKNYEYNFNQKLKLLSFVSDTLNFEGLFIDLKSSYVTDKYVFYDMDPLSLIYENIYNDSISSIDSIFQKTYSNTIELNLIKNAFDFSLFAKFDNNDYIQTVVVDTVYTDIFTGIHLSKKALKFKLNIFARYGVSGYRKEDIDLAFNFKYVWNKSLNLSLNSAYNLNEANLRYVNYSSNHFLWKNYNLSKKSVISNQLIVDFTKARFQFKAENKVFDNYIYLDSNSTVNQNKVKNTISTFKVAKDYRILNFYFRTAIFYQTTSNENLFPLPQFMGRHLIYYQNYLFKKSLKFQIGGNLSFKTNYYAYGYMPALNEFNTQSSEVIGNYPFFDIFINTKFKRAQVFFKYEHYNAGWNGYNYYATTGYPRLDKSFKFGVSWNMID